MGLGTALLLLTALCGVVLLAMQSDRVMSALGQSNQSAAQSFEILEHSSGIAHVASPTREQFSTHFFHARRPVVITEQGKEWPAFTRWTPQYLADNFGDVSIETQKGRESNPRFEQEKHLSKHKQTIPMRDFVSQVTGVGEEGGNDMYIIALNMMLSKPEFQPLYDDVKFPSFIRGAARTGNYFWFGPKGTQTPLHYDPTDLVHTHIYGRKKWYLINPKYKEALKPYAWYSDFDPRDPDYDKYPAMRNVPVHEVIISPGEALFLPLGWFHWVTALDTCISMSMTTFNVTPRRAQRAEL